ncbi:hypothetical protein ACQ4PT_042969 [Festuca glaucescens]
MGSFAKAARFLVLLQIALFVVSAVIMNSSVCHGARDISGGIGYPSLNPNHPACARKPCPSPGQPYTRGPPPPNNGGIGRP